MPKVSRTNRGFGEWDSRDERFERAGKGCFHFFRSALQSAENMNGK
jgi:hypothetical protein